LKTAIKRFSGFSGIFRFLIQRLFMDTPPSLISRVNTAVRRNQISNAFYRGAEPFRGCPRDQYPWPARFCKGIDEPGMHPVTYMFAVPQPILYKRDFVASQQIQIVPPRTSD
jgi:hypothetical protein